MIIDFPHKQLSHCENGAICNLLNFKGLEISEAMIFGIGSGLFFAFMPFVRNQTIPLTSFRIWPGKIQQNVTERLGIKLIRKTYKDRQQAMTELDEMLNIGQPIGLVTNLYYLPYFPKSYRFHFNSHNLVVYGKEGDTYYISDPVIEERAQISRDDLLRARFAKGVMTIAGDMYYPGSIPQGISMEKAIIRGIKSTSNRMIKNPIPYHGVNGINMLSKRIRKEGKKNDIEFIYLFLGNIIRMQEEAGTGGSGFRYMYAAFLQESSCKLQDDQLAVLSHKMTVIGDLWREFAICAGRVIKARISLTEGFTEINLILGEIFERERELFVKLNTISFNQSKNYK
jgi:hypothetical protein